MARASSIWFFVDRSSDTPDFPIAGFGLQYQARTWYKKYHEGNPAIELYRFSCPWRYVTGPRDPKCIQVDPTTGKDIK